MEKAKVYFTKEISPEALVRLYEVMGGALKGKVAVKISTGEPGGHNFLQPALIKDIVHKLDGTIVECNTAYGGRRRKTEDHLKAIEEHGFTKIAPCDILDSEDQMILPIIGGVHLSQNYVGSHLDNYDSILMLSHFKGHMMGGFGGALKNMSIGLASSYGKAHIHGVGEVEKIWTADHDSFLRSMADAAKAVVDHVGANNILYINVANRLSIDCDCDSNPHEPEMGDIGIFASLDPVAIDQACYDAIVNSPDPKKASLIERMDSRNAILIVETAAKHQIGVRDYEIIEI